MKARAKGRGGKRRPSGKGVARGARRRRKVEARKTKARAVKTKARTKAKRRPSPPPPAPPPPKRRGETELPERDPLLRGMLELAVPMWMDRMRPLGTAERELMRTSALDVVAHRADTFMYPGKKGQAAEGFNAIAKGLALLAFCPGGVTFLGLHFEETRAPNA